jgi:CRISPR-associated endoribonuclease Cas6
MTIELNLEPETYNYQIPLNYQYPLSAAIYKLIATSSEEFADWLHEIGYKSGKGKPYKMFVFSKLSTSPIDKALLSKNILKSKGGLHFYFASPVNDKIILNFIQGAMQKGIIKIGAVDLPQTEFTIKSINMLPIITYENNQTYRTISPICVSNFNNGKVEYIFPNNEQIEEKLENNLKEKYKILNEKDFNENLQIEIIDKTQFKQKNIIIKENTEFQGRIKAFETHIRINTTAEMHKIAQECGIGERNSMGFGMMERIGG